MCIRDSHHHRAIRQLGQRVGAGVGTQLLLQHAALGDVGEAGDHAADVTVHVTLRFGVDQQPAQLALRRVHTDGLVGDDVDLGVQIAQQGDGPCLLYTSRCV